MLTNIIRAGFSKPVNLFQFVPNKPSLLFSPQYGNLFRDIDLMVGTASFPSHHMMGDEELKNGISAEKRNKMIR